MVVWGKFEQWMKRHFVEANGLDLSDAKAVAIAADGVWALTKAGLVRFDGSGWLRADSGLTAPPHALLPLKNGKLWAATADGIWEWDEAKWLKIADAIFVQAWTEGNDGTVWVASKEALWRYRQNWELVNRIPFSAEVHGIAAHREQVALATSFGLWFLQGKRFHFKELFANYTNLPTNNISDAAFDNAGHLWMVTDKGVIVFSGGDGWLHLKGSDGLPVEDLRQVCLGKDGSAWFASQVGAIRLKDGEWNYFASKRWLPSDEVRQIAVTDDGSAFIATSEGIAQIWQQPMTLAEKAQIFERKVCERHKRFNYVTVRWLERPGDVNSGRVEISDNDGLWTALYVASECFRYAVAMREGRTDEAEEALHYATESLKAMLFLEQVTGISGFPARAVRHKSEPEFETPHPEWHRTADGEWEWKGDTSSDELDGHFFAYGIAYDLLPDETLRHQVAETTRRIMNHVIEHGFYLVDVDGKPTTWGVWAPERLNHDATWWMEQGLNSLELLAYLKVTHHLTGDERYETFYRSIIEQHHYALNTVLQKIVINGLTNHSDDELAFLSYYSLLRYETDPDLRRLFILSLERTWQKERKERTPLWNFIYGALTGKPCDVEAAIRTLQEIPLDLVHWTVRNSHRADVRIDERLGRFGELQAVEPLQFMERPMHKWNGNPYRLDDGNGGMSEEDPTFFLLPYWLGRYHNLFAEE